MGCNEIPGQVGVWLERVVVSQGQWVKTYCRMFSPMRKAFWRVAWLSLWTSGSSEEAVGAWGQVVVLVDLGEAVGEVVFLVEDGVAGWQFDKFKFGEYQLHLREDVLFDAVVVVDVEESPAEQVVAEVLPFLAVERHVAVAGHVDEGVVEEFAAAHVDYGIVGGEVHVGVGIAEGDEVGERGGVGIPVAATAIFEQRQLGLGVEGGHEEGE